MYVCNNCSIVNVCRRFAVQKRFLTILRKLAPSDDLSETYAPSQDFRVVGDWRLPMADISEMIKEMKVKGS